MCAKLDLVPALLSGKNKYLNKPALAPAEVPQDSSAKQLNNGNIYSKKARFKEAGRI